VDNLGVKNKERAVMMTEEECKEVTLLICGETIDGHLCHIPDGLYYDEKEEEFRCKTRGYECLRVCAKSGNLRKYSIENMNILKLSLVRKKLKILCDYLKQCPETAKHHVCDKCGVTGYHSQCSVCKKNVCAGCHKNFEFGIICLQCLRDTEAAKDIIWTEEQIVPLKKIMEDLEKTRSKTYEEKIKLRKRQTEIVDLWSKQKIWGGTK